MFKVLLGATASLLMHQPALAADVPTDFDGYKKWLDSASQEEKEEHFHAMSENYIKEHGENANKVRLCQNLDITWKGIDLWVDQKWR